MFELFLCLWSVVICPYFIHTYVPMQKLIRIVTDQGLENTNVLFPAEKQTLTHLAESVGNNGIQNYKLVTKRVRVAGARLTLISVELNYSNTKEKIKYRVLLKLLADQQHSLSLRGTNMPVESFPSH